MADEAVFAPDVTVRAQILALLESIVAERGLTLIFVAHDLAVVRRICDQVSVLSGGRLIESGPTELVYSDPQQGYAKELLSAVPTLAKGLAAATARRAARTSRPDEAGSTP